MIFSMYFFKCFLDFIFMLLLKQIATCKNEENSRESVVKKLFIINKTWIIVWDNLIISNRSNTSIS